jgi:transposase
MHEKTYPSDLTDEEWEWIKELIPAAKSGGRPRTLCMRAVLNAILYGTKGGIQWRMLPTNVPKWQSAYSTDICHPVHGKAALQST